MKKLITVKEYCKMMEESGKKVDRREVYKMIKSGELHGKKDKLGKWLIEDPRASIKTTYLTTVEYAEKHGLKVKKVIADCASGKLLAKKEKGRWLIEDRAIDMEALDEEVKAIDVTVHDPEGVSFTAEGLKLTEGDIKKHVEYIAVSNYMASLTYGEIMDKIGSYIVKKVSLKELRRYCNNIKNINTTEYTSPVSSLGLDLIYLIKGMILGAGVPFADAYILDIIEIYNKYSNKIVCYDIVSKEFDKVCSNIAKFKPIKKSVKDKIITIITFHMHSFNEFMDEISFAAMKESYYNSLKED